MRTVLCILILTALAVGCERQRPMSPQASMAHGEIPAVQAGMTKQEVIAIMGRPSGVKAHGRYEYYCYEVAGYGSSNDPATIYVKHEDNLVVGYGRVNYQDNCD